MSMPAGTTGRLVECPACRASMLVPARSMVFPPEVRRRLWIGAGAGAVGAILLGVALHLMALPPDIPGPDGPPASPVAATGSARAPGEKGVRTPDPASPDSGRSAFQDLEMAHRKLNRQYEDLANWVLTNMRGRFLLKDRLVKHLNLPAVTDGYAFHPDMMEYLEVSPRERDLLEDAMGYGLSTMAALEARFLSVTQSAPERVALHIPPYEREGSAMQEDLYRAMETVLGSDRFDRLLDAGERDLVKRYHYFGTAARTMTFTLTAADDPRDPPYLVIRDGWVLPDGPGKRNIQVAEASVREMPKEYLPYLSWLPEYMAAFVPP